MSERIEAVLSSPELEAKWTEAIGGWGCDEATANETLAWLRSERDSILELETAALDPADFETCVMVRFIELRSQWIRYNSLMNYHVLRTGEYPVEMMYRGSLISTLIEAIEPFINRDDLAKACEFLSQPVSSRV